MQPVQSGIQQTAVKVQARERTCWQCGQTFTTGLTVCPHDGTRLIDITLAQDHDPLIGQVLDERFFIERKIGEGGMGNVYGARQGELQVAIKVLKADYLRDENIRRRFMHEARIVANLNHPNAVRLIDFGQMPDGNFFMVMELLRGESLAERLTYKFLSYREVFDLIAPICEVLDEAHSKGVIHRDLKPENIFIQREEDATESPRLIDFGVAKQLERQTITRTGTLWGTPAYMSPEQARGDEIAAGADAYAIGIILYELIAGNLPFSATTQMGYALKHMHEPARSLLSLPGMRSVPARLDALVLSALSKDPAKRPASLRAFAAELRDIRDACFEEAALARVPAEEVDPVALQAWMRAPDEAREREEAAQRVPTRMGDTAPHTPTVMVSSSMEFAASRAPEGQGASTARPSVRPLHVLLVALFALVGLGLLAISRATPAPEAEAAEASVATLPAPAPMSPERAVADAPEAAPEAAPAPVAQTPDAALEATSAAALSAARVVIQAQRASAPAAIEEPLPSARSAKSRRGSLWRRATQRRRDASSAAAPSHDVQRALEKTF